MSPSEHDLRAALRDGEGDRPDVDEVVAGARSARGHRQRRVLGVATAVVVVAGVASGVAVIVSGGNGVLQSNSGEPGPISVAAPSDVVAAPGQGTSRAHDVRCPASLAATRAAPGPADTLFGRSVSTLVVCAYPAFSDARTRLVLSGADATSLARSLNDAARTPPRTACPMYVPAEETSVAFLGVTASGATLPAVTTTLGPAPCNVHVTNGAAVRFAWQPPAALARLLHRAATSTGPIPGRSGTPTTGPGTATMPAQPTGTASVVDPGPDQPSDPHAHGSPVH